MTQPVHLSKHHGLGNDFLVALASRNDGLVPSADLARSWCDRHRGIGADGLIWFLADDRDGIEGRMVLHNRDGSEAEISGNGIRCLAQAVAIDRGVTSAHFVVATAAGDRHLDVTPGDATGTCAVRVDMGTVRTIDAPGEAAILAAGVPQGVLRRVAAGEVGNPHLVLWLDDLDACAPDVVGPAVEALVPGGINVHFVRPVEGSRLEVRHWERGAGVTEACGSGATVSAWAARGWGAVGDDVTVTMPGGAATVILRGDDAALVGPATHIAEIEVMP